MKNKFRWTSVLVAVILIVASASPVFAQSETDPPTDPTPVAEGSSFLDNPIVRLLSNFFSGLLNPPPPEETPTPDAGGDTGDPAPTDAPEGDSGDGVGDVVPTEEPTPVPTLSAEEMVASMHTEEDLGFGEITKLLQIATEAQESCQLYGTNCDVTVDSLLAEYNSGLGMGQLFDKYGKPEITGVGQTKKVVDEDGNKVKSNNGKANGKNK
ncbi:MAG: hypothetical protein PWQ55_1982 [Chloroflexota bacterium]|nr:hypothetical protein [Chloroflexota bacterium]